MGSKKGRKITWGDKISIANSGVNHPMYGKHHSQEAKNKISAFLKGRKLSKEICAKISLAKIGKIGYWHGKKRPIETRMKMSKTHKDNKEKSHLWRGGITPINKTIRLSLEYKLWREAVFKRDGYTCIWCGSKKSGTLNADHIKPFALYPKLRLVISNGRTLCISCHKTTESYLNRKILTGLS